MNILKFCKNTLLFFASLLIAIILSLVISEFVFFLTHGDWYREKSYLALKSIMDHSGLYYGEETQTKPIPQEYKLVIVENILGETDISALQDKMIINDNFKEGYDIVVSVWMKCIDYKNVKLSILSGGEIYSSILVDKNVVERDYCLYLVSTPFNGEAKIFVEGINNILSSKGLRIFFKKHATFFNYPKPANTYRILVIGGSTSAIYMAISHRDAYSFVMQKYFDAIWQDRIDVLNLAAPGGQVNDYLNRIKDYYSLRPDMVILSPVWNDANTIAVERYLLNRKIFRNIRYFDLLSYVRENKFFANFALGYYLYRILNRFILKEELKRLEEFNTRYDVRTRGEYTYRMISKDKYWGVYERRLKLLVEAFTEKNIKVILLTLPSLSTGIEPTSEEQKLFVETLKRYSNKNTFVKVMKLHDFFKLIDDDVIFSVARKTGVIVINSEKDSIYSSSPYSVRKDFFVDHGHFTPKGAELIGKIVVGKIYKIIKDSIDRL